MTLPQHKNRDQSILVGATIIFFSMIGIGIYKQIKIVEDEEAEAEALHQRLDAIEQKLNLIERTVDKNW